MILENTKYRNFLLILGSVVLIIGLPTSPALISIATGIFGFLFLFQKHIFALYKEKFKDSIYIGFYILFFLHFLSFFTSENTNEVWDEIKIKLPFLLIPMGFMAMPTVSLKLKNQLSFLFLFVISTIAIASVINYFLHYEMINNLILHSKEIPVITKITHIYFSAMLAFAIFVAFNLYKYLKNSDIILFFSNEKYFIVFLGLLSFICLHILATRTGLFSFYIGLMLYGIYIIILYRKYYIGISLMIMIILMPIIANYTLTSFHNRVVNTYQDIQIWQHNGDISNRSISMRFATWQTAWHVFQKNWIFGVGISDIDTAIDKQYDLETFKLNKGNRLKDLHNQFFEYSLGFGIIGLFALIFTIFYPFYFNNFRNNDILIQLICICSVAMTAESLLERQVGICFFTFFYLLYAHKEDNSSSF